MKDNHWLQGEYIKGGPNQAERSEGASLASSI